jgi:hypothetical protein
MKVIVVSGDGHGFIASRSGSSWLYKSLALNEMSDRTLHQVVPLSPLPLFLIGAASSIHLVSAEDGMVQHTFATEAMISRSIRCVYTCARQTAAQQEVGLTSLSIGYSAAGSREGVLLFYSSPSGADAISTNAPSGSAGGRWCTWEEAAETKKRIVNPGVWDIVQNGSVVGIRRISRSGGGKERAGLRYRGAKANGLPSATLKRWQTWTTLASDRVDMDEARPLVGYGEDIGHLLISELGPKVKLGLKSVAFAFGNAIKVVTTGGQERYESEGEGSSEPLLQVGNRRRRHGGSTRSS